MLLDFPMISCLSDLCNLQWPQPNNCHPCDPLCPQVNETTTGRFVINLKNNQTEYCGYVVYRPLSEWGRLKSENTSFCVTLPGEDNEEYNLFSLHYYWAIIAKKKSIVSM